MAGDAATRRDLDRRIARLAVPALGALVAEPLYLLADTAVVGHLGTEPLGGLAVAGSVLLVVTSVFIFLAYGTTASVSRLLGAGREDEAAAHAVQSLWIALAGGIAAALALAALAEPLVGALGATGEVRDQALIYLRTSLPGLPALLVVLAGTGYLRGLQDTRATFAIALGSAVANLAIELVLVLGLNRGIGASALSTVLAQVGAALAYVAFIRRAVRGRDVVLRPDPARLLVLARQARDLLVRTAALRASLLAATAVAARIGVVELGAHQIAFELWSFLALVLDSLAIAAQALVGRSLGAGDVAGARAVARRTVQLGALLGAALGLGLLLLRGVLPGLFTGDPDVAAATTGVLVWAALLQPLNGVVFALDGVLIGASDLRFLARAMVLAAATFLPAAWAVLAVDAGLDGLWAAIALLMAVRALVLGARLRHDRWATTGA